MNEEEYLNVLWEQFGIETAEHLESLENLLIDLEFREVESDELSALFRSFHTVKGLSKSMELLAMEAVAHRSEDILGLVRDEGAPLSAETINILLDAIAALQSLREIAVQERLDSDKPTDLIQQLEEVFNSLSKVISGEDVVSDSSSESETEEEEPDKEIPQAPLPSITQNIDPDILEFYAETMRNSLPTIAKLATQIKFGAEDEETINVLDTLAFASENLEFDHVAQTFSQLKALLELQAELTEEQKYEKLKALGYLPQTLLTLEEETNLDFGYGCFLDNIPTDLHQKLIECLDLLNAKVVEFETEVQQQEEFQISSVSGIFKQSKLLLPYARLLKVNEVNNLLTAVTDIYQRAVDALESDGEGLHLNLELVGISRKAFDLCIKLVNSAIENLAETYPQEVKQLFEDIHRNVMGEDEQSEASHDTLQQLRQLGLHEEYFPLLTDDIVQNIAEKIAQQSNLLLLNSPADMDEQTASQFLLWLQSGIEVFTSRSIVGKTSSEIEFFLAGQESFEATQKQLADIDNNQNILCLSVLGDIQAASGESESQAEPEPPKPESVQAETQPEQAKNTQSASTPSQAATPKTAPARNVDKEQNMIRVNGAVLDQFMDQIGEMVLIRSQLNHLLHDEQLNVTQNQLKLAIANLKSQLIGGEDEHEQLEGYVETILEHNHNLIQVDMQIHSTLNQLQEEVMELRVVPIENVFKRFPRVVRDLAKSQGKKVQFEMQGGEVRIDKGMVDLLVDPLMHMIRNSVDHGVELPEQRQQVGKTAQAKLLLKANQRGNQVIIDIIDDGKGIDAEKIKQKIIDRELLSEPECRQLSDSEAFAYIFEAGFSTAAKLTETSGRGVGLDVVKTVVNKLGGKIELNSKPNEGTQFSMEFPLSAAIQNTLLVEVNQQVFAIPDRYVAEVIETPPESIQSIKGCKAILLREVFLPIVYLGDLLNKRHNIRKHETDLPVVVLSNGYNRLGLEVDKLYHRQELFIKEVNPQLAALPGVGGASILGNGKVVLILDGEDLFTLGSQCNSKHSNVRQHSTSASTGRVINQ